MILIINEKEWDDRPLFLRKYWKIWSVQEWQEEENVECCAREGSRAEKVVVLTCTDQGIAVAGRRNLPVIAVRSAACDRERGKQSLFGAPVLLEDPRELDAGLVELVWKRFYGIPRIIGETQRCRIREICDGDLPFLYRASGGVINEGGPDSFVLDWEEYQAFWQAYRKNQYGFFEYGLWLIEKRTDREAYTAVGMAGFSDAGELSYWTAPEYRGQGYAKEACRFLISYAGSVLGWKELLAQIQKENLPSLKLAESLGFQKDSCKTGSKEGILAVKQLVSSEAVR